MPRLVHRNPTYRKHKATGQAIVTLSGEDHYLGPYGTKASRDEYDRVLAEWLARGRRPTGTEGTGDAKVVELIATYWRFCQEHYSPDPRHGEMSCIKLAIALLRRLYGKTDATAFGPLSLMALRDAFVKEEWSRSFVNAQVSRIRRMMKWAVSREMVPPSVYHALVTVDGLRAGKTEARETEPVRPVPEEHVEAVQPWVSRQVWAMIQLQLITGMRPGEVVIMRTCDIERSREDVWLYRPQRHKTQGKGFSREIWLGPRARAVLEPFQKPDVQAPLFSPVDAENERRTQLRAARRTPVQPSQVLRAEFAAKRMARRTAAGQYTVDSYRRAIARACEKANAWARGGMICENEAVLISAWHPHQLRHTTATTLRAKYGLEATQAILGHQTLKVTQVYAEKNVAAARRIMGEAG